MLPHVATTSQRILTPRRVAAHFRVGAYMLGTADAQMISDLAWDQVCHHLMAMVLTDTQVSETQEVGFRVPATWWQHFRRDNWLGRKIWPRREIREAKLTRRITFERIRGYPMADVAPPGRFGAPVVYDTTDWGPQIADA